MTSIKLSVSGAMVLAEVDGLLTSGMVGIPVTISYDEEWDGLTKTLVCRSGVRCRKIPNVDEQAIVAHEVMTAGQTLYLGVEGRNADGTLVISTVWADCGKIEFGASADCEPAVDSILLIWKQMQNQMGSLEDLDTSDKSNLVAAINEAAGTGGGGMSAAARALLIAILRAAVYTSNQTANITNLQAALGASAGSGSETPGDGNEGSGGDDDANTDTYTITNVLTNVTTSNTAASVAKNASYSATLTAADGYELEIASVTMGGVDITLTSYFVNSKSVIIESVTGDVVIIASAVAKESGGGVVNLFDKDTMVSEGKFYDASGVLSSGSAYSIVTIPIKAGKTYSFYKGGASYSAAYLIGSWGCVVCLDADGNVLELTYNAGGTSISENDVFTVATNVADGIYDGVTMVAPENAAYFGITIRNTSVDYTDTFMFEEGDTCHEYVAYSGSGDSGGSGDGSGSGDGGDNTYSVTCAINDLEAGTSERVEITVEANAAYTTTLTAPDGYELDTVTVTMGGNDITATAYSAGVVTIASVTADVVINANIVSSGSGSESSGVVNLFDKNTMVTEDYFIDTSGKPLSSSGSKYATVPVSANTTYALQKGSAWNANEWGSGANGNIGYYDSAMLWLSAENMATPAIMKDTSGIGIKLTTPENTAYVRLSLKVYASGIDYTDTFMIEEGDTCHDYVAFV